MTETLPTGAASALGALVAALVILELSKLLEGRASDALRDAELYMDCHHHRSYVTRLARNPECRFDHQTWGAEIVSDVPLDTLYAELEPHPVLSMAGARFATTVPCPHCGNTCAIYSPHRAGDHTGPPCPHCAVPLAVPGASLSDRLPLDSVPESERARTLSAWGMEPGDVFELDTPQAVSRYELAGPDGLAVGAPSPAGATVILAGLGNIGSHVAPHLGRDASIARVVLIDPDHYEPHNLQGQDIEVSAIDQPKVTVQRERLLRIAPHLDVIAIPRRLEAVPLGRYRNAIVIGALDSRLARMQLNERAFRAGSPWIDTAVDGPGSLCRLCVYEPIRNNEPCADASCIECGWDDVDYRDAQEATPCERQAEDRPAGAAK